MSVPGRKAGEFGVGNKMESEELCEVFCQPCSDDGQKLSAVGFCVDCCEYLCRKCYKIHLRVKPSRNHVLQDKSTMPRSMPQINTPDASSDRNKAVTKTADVLIDICPQHQGEVIKFHCLSHDQLGCGVCFAIGHKKCDNISYIEEEYEQLEQTLTDLQQQIDNQSSVYKQNLVDVEAYSSGAVENITKFKNEIMNFFDKLENVSKSKVKQIKDEDEKNMRSISVLFDTVRNEIQSLPSEELGTLHKTKQNGKLFAAIDKTKVQIKMLEDSLSQIRNGNKIKNYTFETEKQIADLMENLTALGRISPVIGPNDNKVINIEQTQETIQSGNNSYEYEAGRGNVTRCLCGLSNIGNTCFMNSVLQCMSNVPKLTQYILSNTWAEEINEDNPLGMHGEIAKSYAELIQVMWSGKYRYTVPRNFKVVAKEAWDIYKLKNDSVTTDIFHGLLKSTVQCQKCAKISVTFDPFCNLSLPVSVKNEPVKNGRKLKIFWMPLDNCLNPKQIKFTVPKDGGIDDLCEALSQVVGVYKEYMVVTDVYNHRFHKVFAMTEAISQIMDRDDIFVYEVPITSYEDPEQIVMTIYLREESGKSKYNQPYIGTYKLFGQPLLLAVPRNNCTYDLLYNFVLKRMGRFIKVPADSEKWWTKEVERHDIVREGPAHDDSREEINNGEPPRLFKLTVVNSNGTAEMEYKLKEDGTPLKLNSRMYISADWSRLAKGKFYNESEAESFAIHDSMKNQTQHKQLIQLNECLELFTTTEKLAENEQWFCPQCKNHQQATKKFDLWSLPDTLVIHLKRFSNNGDRRDKNDALIEFPTESLDLGKYVIDPDKDTMVYDLIGVSNHYSGLGGGHYTAYCRNHEEDKWFYFDDSSVSESSDKALVRSLSRYQGAEIDDVVPLFGGILRSLNEHNIVTLVIKDAMSI